MPTRSGLAVPRGRLLSPSRRRISWVMPALVLVVLVGGGMRSVQWRSTLLAGEPELAPEEVPTWPGLENDLRLRAFSQAYESLIDSVAILGDDAVFVLGGESIYFQDGRMLSEARLGDPQRFDPIFYRYPLGSHFEATPLTENPVYSTDVLESLFGKTETQIRKNGESAAFLDHTVFMNVFTRQALEAVERDLRAAAEGDPSLATWIRDIDVAYSFIDRKISGSGNRSYHAWGLAVDLVPTSYGGKHVYWRWSRVFNRDDWHQIPASKRWSPPAAVIEAFERHGFVWGGKWTHFDTIHFEYRPEILLYNQMIEAARVAARTR